MIATRFAQIDYLRALQLGSQITDSPALTLCMHNHLPIIVCDMNVAGNTRRARARCLPDYSLFYPEA